MATSAERAVSQQPERNRHAHSRRSGKTHGREAHCAMLTKKGAASTPPVAVLLALLAVPPVPPLVPAPPAPLPRPPASCVLRTSSSSCLKTMSGVPPWPQCTHATPSGYLACMNTWCRSSCICCARKEHLPASACLGVVPAVCSRVSSVHDRPADLQLQSSAWHRGHGTPRQCHWDAMPAI